MHFRLLRALSAATFASALFLGLASPASAGPKDKDAEKLLKDAMDNDYLATEFAKAEKKLKDALTKCGSSGCSPELVGKIQIAIGTVYGVGLSQNADAKTAFVAALKADPNAVLDPSLTTPDLQKIYNEAKKSAGSGSSTPPPKPPPSTSDSGYTPPAEAPVNTPIPIYVEPDDSVPLSKVVLRYKPFGNKEFKSVELKKMSKGWGGLIPCEDATTTGDMKFFFAFTGTDGEAAGGLGSSKEPFKTTIKNELEGDAPRLPGKKPPEVCKQKEDCPPGLEGCPDSHAGTVKHGDKGWGSSCDSTAECKEGLACLNGTCEEGKGGDEDKKEDTGKKRMNLIGLGVQFDFVSLKSSTRACDGSDPSYECFIQNQNNVQFFGVPVPNFKNTDGISGGGDFAGARILVGYDRQLVKKLGLSVGVRLGYAFGGPQGSPVNSGMLLSSGMFPQQPIAKAFLPFHGEVRLSYHILGSMMDDKKFRPYVFAGGGTGQVNGSVSVAVCDSNLLPMEVGTNCNVPGIAKTVLREVNAYQVTGLGFIEFGGGTTFGITPLFGFAAELKFMFMVPTFGFVVAPNLGPVFNF